MLDPSTTREESSTLIKLSTSRDEPPGGGVSKPVAFGRSRFLPCLPMATQSQNSLSNVHHDCRDALLTCTTMVALAAELLHHAPPGYICSDLQMLQLEHFGHACWSMININAGAAADEQACKRISDIHPAAALPVRPFLLDGSLLQGTLS